MQTQTATVYNVNKKGQLVYTVYTLETNEHCSLSIVNPRVVVLHTKFQTDRISSELDPWKGCGLSEITSSFDTVSTFAETSLTDTRLWCESTQISCHCRHKEKHWWEWKTHKKKLKNSWLLREYHIIRQSRSMHELYLASLDTISHQCKRQGYTKFSLA